MSIDINGKNVINLSLSGGSKIGSILYDIKTNNNNKNEEIAKVKIDDIIDHYSSTN